MLHPDPRAYRVALVADAIVNDGAAGFDVVAELDAANYGMIVLPPSDFPISTIDSIVEYVVDDLADYSSHGYRVVVVGSSQIAGFGVWDHCLQDQLRRRGLEPFDRIDVSVSTADTLADFLTNAR